jgi:uncharacterized protein YutD
MNEYLNNYSGNGCNYCNYGRGYLFINKSDPGEEKRNRNFAE